MENTICKTCGEKMERRRHKIITAKMLRQPYIFTEYDVCPNCGRIQTYEKYKLFIQRSDTERVYKTNF